MSPYRLPAVRRAPVEPERLLDTDLVAPLVVFWIASVARVILGVARRERCSTEGALAMLAGVFVPLLIARIVADWYRVTRGR
jgi:hypothetical protein